MIAVSVVGAKETAGRLQRLERDVPTALERAVGRASLLIRHELGLQMSGTGPRDPFLGRMGAPAPFLGTRTGATKRRLSPGGQVYRLGNVAVAAVGSPDRHVLAHEEGATITGSPYLRIPLAAAQTGAGQDRFVGRSVRGIKDIFLLKTGRWLFLVRKKGGGVGNLYGARKGRGALEFLYLLKRSVRLPARGVFKAVTNRMRPAVVGLLGSAVSIQVERANRG